VDAAVFEVGLGGERDATACLRPDLSILTHVSYDHTHILGQTLEEIAREKAGVIHRGKKFLWAGDPGLSSFFRQCCRRKQAQFFESKPILNTTIISDIRGTRGQFNFKGSKLTLQTSLRGNYQAENIQTSLQVFELLDRDCTVTAKHCKRGLQSTNHPSRLELLSENPLILVDGSHNAAGIQSLTDWAMRVLPGTQVFFALCIKVNKDHEEISKSLKGFELLLFRPSKGPYLKKKDFEKYYPMGTYVRGYKNLLGYFFSAKPKSKALIVTGSLPIAARVKCFYSKYVKKKARGLDPQA